MTLFNFKYALLTTSLLSFATIQPIYALESDAKQSIEIEANQAQIDALSEESVYTGQVSIKQGTLSILANEVKLKAKDQKLQQLEARGKPVKFEQAIDNQKEKIKGSGYKLVYDPIQEKITLIGQAELQQGQAKFSGDQLEYHIPTRRIFANSNPQNTATTPKRVRMVLPPQSSAKVPQ
jgi:lipopolysaccharide export system protein LptA